MCICDTLQNLCCLKTNILLDWSSTVFCSSRPAPLSAYFVASETFSIDFRQNLNVCHSFALRVYKLPTLDPNKKVTGFLGFTKMKTEDFEKKILRDPSRNNEYFHYF